jgi:HAD superfamily hydrolase (TIGR01509 family)
VGALAVDRLKELEAVTIDAHGTLVVTIDPTPKLVQPLADRGVVRSPDEIRRAFRAEGAYYRGRSVEGRDADSLARVHRDCVAVFLETLDADLDPDEFAPVYVDSLEFELLPGARESVERLAAAGLPLAVVANWDMTLPEVLASLGVYGLFTTIVTSAEAGTAKPDPAIFRLALERLAARPERSLHIGDDPVDEDGARATGMWFVPAPLAEAVQAVL